MAIEGPISELALSDLLQLLHLSRRSGALTASGGSLGTTTLFLEDGSLIGATSSAPELRLGRLLLGSGRITDSQLGAALERQQRHPEERLGQVLVETGAATAREVEAALRFQIDEAVLELMRWQDGYLRFADLHPRSPGKVAIRASTDSVLMEAARRLDELHELVGSPTLDPIPRLTAGEGADGYVHLAPLDWEVLAEVDGKRTLRGIALALGRQQLEVARSLYKLTSSGVVELGGAPSKTGRGVWIEPQVILGRIDAAIEERRVDEAATLLHGARSAVDPVELLIREGRIAALMNDWDAASEAFGSAAVQAPSRADTHYYLARVLLFRMDLPGAERALQQYMTLGDISEQRNLSAIRMIESIQELRRTALESAP